MFPCCCSSDEVVPTTLRDTLDLVITYHGMLQEPNLWLALRATLPPLDSVCHWPFAASLHLPQEKMLLKADEHCEDFRLGQVAESGNIGMWAAAVDVFKEYDLLEEVRGAGVLPFRCVVVVTTVVHACTGKVCRRWLELSSCSPVARGDDAVIFEFIDQVGSGSERSSTRSQFVPIPPMGNHFCGERLIGYPNKVG